MFLILDKSEPLAEPRLWQRRIQAVNNQTFDGIAVWGQTKIPTQSINHPDHFIPLNLHPQTNSQY